MTECNTLSSAVAPPAAPERRSESRVPVSGSLWIIDHNGSTVLKCQCVESSQSGLRLRVPLGYGIAEGQRYELRSHLPGRQPVDGFGIVGQRWATVVRTQVRIGDDDDHLDVGVVLDMAGGSALTLAATAFRA